MPADKLSALYGCAKSRLHPFPSLTRLLRASVDSRLGRRLRDRELVIGSSWRGMRERGVDLRPRLVGASGRTVTFEDGTTTDVAAVVWATGFRPDHGWLDVPGAVVDGAPVHTRGISPVPHRRELRGLPIRRRCTASGLCA